MYRIARCFCNNKRCLHTGVEVTNATLRDYITSDVGKSLLQERIEGFTSPAFFKARSRSAVLVPLCIVDGDVSLLYTKRSARLKKHPGQVSFPGGKPEEHDTSLVHTALRETEEELGLQRTDIEVIGTLNVCVPTPATSVVPVIATLGEINIQQLRPDPNEVYKVFHVPLAQMLLHYNYTLFAHGWRMPVYRNPTAHVWGVTGLVTDCFLAAAFPHHYQLVVRQTFPTQKKVEK